MYNFTSFLIKISNLIKTMTLTGAWLSFQTLMSNSWENKPYKILGAYCTVKSVQEMFLEINLLQLTNNLLSPFHTKFKKNLWERHSSLQSTIKYNADLKLWILYLAQEILYNFYLLHIEIESTLWSFTICCRNCGKKFHF